MFKTFFLLLIVVNSTAELGQSGARAQVSTNNLPGCVDSPSDLETIVQAMKSNSKTSHKYDGYKKVFGGASDSELLARLAYAETLAANCPSENAKVAPIVTAVIKNRVTIRKNDVASVVFERDQFASSLNNYSESRSKEFLCP